MAKCCDKTENHGAYLGDRTLSAPRESRANVPADAPPVSVTYCKKCGGTWLEK